MSRQRTHSSSATSDNMACRNQEPQQHRDEAPRRHNKAPGVATRTLLSRRGPCCRDTSPPYPHLVHDGVGAQDVVFFGGVGGRVLDGPRRLTGGGEPDHHQDLPNGEPVKIGRALPKNQEFSPKTADPTDLALGFAFRPQGAADALGHGEVLDEGEAGGDGEIGGVALAEIKFDGAVLHQDVGEKRAAPQRLLAHAVRHPQPPPVLHEGQLHLLPALKILPKTGRKFGENNPRRRFWGRGEGLGPGRGFGVG